MFTTKCVLSLTWSGTNSSSFGVGAKHLGLHFETLNILFRSPLGNWNFLPKHSIFERKRGNARSFIIKHNHLISRRRRRRWIEAILSRLGYRNFQQIKCFCLLRRGRKFYRNELKTHERYHHHRGAMISSSTRRELAVTTTTT